jgi:RimJ/RimL family protein N-acetyltransferase
MTAYTIREATEDDAEKLIAYLVELSKEPDIPLPLTPGSVTLTLEQEREYLHSHLEPENSTYLVAEAEGEIIGVFHCTGYNQELTRKMTQHCGEMGVSVRKDWRNQGVGTALMKRGLDWARSVSLIKRIQLEVFTDNERAIHIYKKLGFEVEGRRRRAFLRNGTFIDSFLMALLIE